MNRFRACGVRGGRRVAQAAGAVLLLTAVAACSSDGRTRSLGEVVEQQGNPADCGGAAGKTVELDGSEVQVNMGHNPYTGTLAVTVLSAQNISEPFEDPFISGTVVPPQGRFVAVRFKISNELNAGVQPSTVVFDNLQLTDGTKSWPVADYNGVHTDAPSWGWSVNHGDEQGATEVGAGFDEFTWALFDIPDGATPTGLAFQTSARQLCLAMPPLG